MAETFGEDRVSLAMFPAFVSLPLKLRERDRGVRFLSRAWGLTLLVAWLGMTAAMPATEVAPLRTHEAFFEQHCFDCHEGAKAKGDFRLDTLGELAPADAARGWGRIYTRLEAGEMPPPKRDRPPGSQAAGVLQDLKLALAAEAETRRKSGRTRLRRLNRLEYENTMHGRSRPFLQ
jgi:hypothetical protein